MPELAAATLNQVRVTIASLAEALADRCDAPALDIRLFAGASPASSWQPMWTTRPPGESHLDRVNGALDQLGTGFARSGGAQAGTLASPGCA